MIQSLPLSESAPYRCDRGLIILDSVDSLGGAAIAGLAFGVVETLLTGTTGISRAVGNQRDERARRDLGPVGDVPDVLHHFPSPLTLGTV